MPEEVWTGSKPDLGHLRMFVCSAYVHVTEKTGPRAINGVFVGYPMGTKGYRVWIKEEGRCRTSRNGVFNEDELYKHIVAKKKESTEVAKDKEKHHEKQAKKRVSFSDELIRGPSPSAESEDAPDQGGEDSSSESSKSDSDTEQEHEVESENGDGNSSEP